MRDRCEYEVMPCDVVVGPLKAWTEVAATKEGYVSQDADAEKLVRLMKRGFRWVRTEHGHAVFERKVQS